MKDLSTKEIMDLSSIQDDEVKPLKDLINEEVDCEKYKIGYDVFDEALDGGIKDGDLMVISGISGQGKTSFAQSLTYNLCKNSIPCLWFSYEVSLNHLNKKFRKMGISDFYHVFSPKKNTTGKLEWIKYKIKESWVKYATKVIFIDHIDFLTPSSVQTRDNETIALKKIATELKSLAVELDVIIVVMAHLKKLPSDKEPDMQDIGYSAGIFQLADYVFMVMREKVNKGNAFGNINTNEIYTNNSIIKIVKNRETGQLKFIKCQYKNERFIQLTNNYEKDDADIKRTAYFHD